MNRTGSARWICLALVCALCFQGILLLPATGLAEDVYKMVTKDNVVFRSDKSSNSSKIANMKVGTVVKSSAYEMDDKGEFGWEKITMVVELAVGPRERTGYIRSDMLRDLTAKELEDYLKGLKPSTPTPTPTGQTYNNDTYMYVSGTSVRLRQGPSTTTESLEMLHDGQKVKVVSRTGEWYSAQTGNATGFIHGDYLRASEGATVAPNVTATPNPSGLLVGGAAIKGGGVNVRTGSGMSFGKIDTLSRDKIVRILGSAQGTDGKVWYRIGYDGKTGYIAGEYLRALKAGENVGDADGGSSGDSSGGSSGGKTATYRVLKVGSKGADVEKLQKALKSKGYLKAGVITDYYGTMTRDAVKAYQKKVGLKADGIAGAATQHKLYGTVPEVTPAPTVKPTAIPTAAPTLAPGVTATPKPNVGGVELNNWFTGDIQSVLAANRTLTVVDVRTGKRFNVRYIHGANHADGEPLTKADTAVLKEGSGNDRLYGSYRRPVWVICGGRTFAGSMYCIPHDEKSRTITDNDFPGVLCLHFFGSKTHTNPNGSGTQEHQECVMEAYNAAASKI